MIHLSSYLDFYWSFECGIAEEPLIDFLWIIFDFLSIYLSFFFSCFIAALSFVLFLCLTERFYLVDVFSFLSFFFFGGGDVCQSPT